MTAGKESDLSIPQMSLPMQLRKNWFHAYIKFPYPFSDRNCFPLLLILLSLNRTDLALLSSICSPSASLFPGGLYAIDSCIFFQYSRPCENCTNVYFWLLLIIVLLAFWDIDGFLVPIFVLSKIYIWSFHILFQFFNINELFIKLVGQCLRRLKEDIREELFLLFLTPEFNLEKSKDYYKNIVFHWILIHEPQPPERQFTCE